MASRKLPDIQTLTSKNSKLVIHFDPAKVPGRNASLATKLQFAADYFESFLNGRVGTPSALRLCIRWIREARRYV